MEYRKVFLVMIVLPLLMVSLTVGINYVVDPYNVNRMFDLGMRKDIVSYRGNYRLYKMQAYKNEACANIYLGDSRMDGLSKANIEAVSGEKWFNFAYGGGSAYEIIDSFWYAAGRQKLHQVVIGLNFNLYNGSNRLNLTKAAMSTLDSPMRYYLSYTTLKMSLANVAYKYMGINMYAEEPAMSKDEFWQDQLGKTTDVFYGHYYHPDDLQEALAQIRDYCVANDIELTFVFPPTHVDLQKRVLDYGLQEEYERYKKEIKGLGMPTYDFDVDSTLTRDKALYKDPYHADMEVKDEVIREVFKARK